jgi:hypothetical protein
LQEAENASNHLKMAVTGWIQNLDSEASTWINVLVQEDSLRMMKRSDFDKVVELMEVLPQDLIASEQPGLTQERILNVMRAFYASLFSTAGPQFDRLQDPDVREIARRKAAEQVANSYALVSTIAKYFKLIF